MNIFFKASVTLFILLSSCAGEKDCKFGKPSPIFSKEMKVVQEHSFEVKGQESVESIKFADDFLLEVLQSGCDHLFQQFTFEILDDFSGKNYVWPEVAAELLFQAAGADKSLMHLESFAYSIGSNAPKITLGEKFELDKGTFVTLNKVASSQRLILTIAFTDEE